MKKILKKSSKIIVTDAPKQEPEEPDFSKAKEHLDFVCQEMVKLYGGKPGYNPYFYFKKNILPLRDRHHLGERSQKLFDEMMAIKVVEPKV